MKKLLELTTALWIALLVVGGFAGCTAPTGQEEGATSEESPRESESVEDLLATNIRKTEPLSPEEELKTFHVPEGFEVQLFASEPDIGKPMNISFDARGRLWVTQSHEYPFPAREGEESDKVGILEDTNGDGRADKITTFAEGLNIPIGVIPVEGGAIVHSIPYIYRFFDLDGDDHADDKVVLYGRFGYQDTHGMVNAFTRGFDGWIYACHGFTNESTVRGADGHAISMTSGNTFRFRQDGLRVEQNTYGQVNPFGLTFDAQGNLYSVDCHSKPVYQLLSGGSYPHFGRLPSGIGFGPEMLHHQHGSTAIAGIVYFTGSQFPEEFQNNVLTGDVITNRLYRDRIEFNGSMPTAVHQDDFMVSDDPWFRPVDLEIGPDGALYVADFYNRIIGHYEVPLTHPGRDRSRGRIWRVVYKEGVKEASRNAARGDWTRASVTALIEDLGHANLTVRMLAMDQLVDRIGSSAIEPLLEMLKGSNASPLQRIHGLWALYQLNALNEDLLQAAAADEDRDVRVHAMRILAQTSDFGAREHELVLAGLSDSDPLVRRQAADALRLHPAEENVDPLLQLASTIDPADKQLEYEQEMALRDQLRDKDILQSVLAGNWSDTEKRELASVLVGVDTAPAASFLLDRLLHLENDQEVSLVWTEHVSRFLPADKYDRLVKWAVSRRWDDPEQEHDVFRSLQLGAAGRTDSSGDQLLPWGRSIVRRLVASKDEETQGIGYRLAGDIKLKSLAPQLVKIMTSDKESVDLRIDAARSLALIDEERYVPLLVRTLKNSARLPALRNRLQGILLGGESLAAKKAIAELIPIMQSQQQLGMAGRLSRTTEGAEILLEAVEKGEIPATVLLYSPVRMNLSAYSKDLAEKYEKLTANLEPEPEEQLEVVQDLLKNLDLDDASPVRGWNLFQEHCMRCHQIGGQGKTIGPQLDGVSERGPARLVEDVATPSRNVAPGFRTRVIQMANGSIRMGLPIDEDEKSLVLLDDLENESRVLKSDIASIREVEESPMPPDFAQLMTSEQFSDLISFLLSPKEGMAKKAQASD